MAPAPALPWASAVGLMRCCLRLQAIEINYILMSESALVYKLRRRLINFKELVFVHELSL